MIERQSSGGAWETWLDARPRLTRKAARADAEDLIPRFGGAYRVRPYSSREPKKKARRKT